MSPSHDEVRRLVDDYYSEKVRTHGPTHRGVDWNSQESQELRFDQVLRVVDTSSAFSINDVGCGYGALAGYLQGNGFDFRFYGLDFSQAMIDQARRIYADASNCTFGTDPSAMPVSDYSVASGIFSVRLTVDDDLWRRHAIDTIALLAEHSTKGFAFNMLTKYSDADKMRPDLYYADPHYYFDYCRERFSRRVALLHDYPLYEFTILVRL